MASPHRLRHHAVTLLCAGLLLPMAAQARLFYVLTSGNSIATVNEASPASPGPALPVSGIASGQSLVAIDVRPMNNRLYGLTTDGAGGVELYLIDMQGPTPYANSLGSPGQLVNGSGTPLPVTGTSFGMDFNPMSDRLRVVTGSGMNFRMNPNTGLFLDGNAGTPGINPDGSANTGSTTFDDVAYTNARADAAATIAFAIDSVSQELFTLNPPNSGTLTQGFPIRLNGNPLNFSADTGLDVALDGPTAAPNVSGAGVIYASLTVGGISGLYRLSAQGDATLVGQLGGLSVKDIAVAQTPSASLSLDASGTMLTRFLTRLPSLGVNVPIAVAGLTASERLVGMDLRPATGQYMALGVNPTADTATLYVLDPFTGALSRVGSPSGIAFVAADGTTPIDFPDGTYGVTFSPQTDRLRVVASNGVNFRCDPQTGLPVDGNFGGATTAGINPDGGITGSIAAGLDGAAYTGNQYSGLPGTAPSTLYTLDAAGHRLAIQSPPNSGTQTTPLGITLHGAALSFAATTGFDVPPGWTGTASNLPVQAIAYAALTVAGVTHLYTIQLGTADASDVGAIGNGTTAMIGLVVGSDDDIIFQNGFQ